MALGTPYTALSSSVQQSTGTSWLTGVITHDIAVGDVVVVAVLNTNTAVTGVTDSNGNVYTKKNSSTGSSLKTYEFVLENHPGLTIAGSGKFTVTFGNLSGVNSEIAIIVRGVSGAKLSGSVDPNSTPAGVNGSSTAPAETGGTTLAQANEYIMAALASSNAAGGPTAWGAGLTQQSQQHQTGFAFLTVADKITSVTTAINASATLAVSGTWAICQVGIEEATAGATPQPLFGMDAQAPWSTVESDLGISAIPGWRAYNPPASGVPSSFPGTQAGSAPAGVTTRVVSIKPNLPLSDADKAKLATYFASMKTGDAVTLWHEGEKSGYTPAQIKAAHAAAYDIFKLNAPPGCKYGQIVMTYTASGFSSHGPLGQWIAVQTNGQPLDFYGLDAYPNATGDASGSVAASTAWAAVTAVVPSAVLAITETCYTTDNVNGITWSGAQEDWFADIWNWAVSNNAIWFFPYFNAANNVPWSGNTTACKNELKTIAQASLSQTQNPVPHDFAAAKESISVSKPTPVSSVADPPFACLTMNRASGLNQYTGKLTASVRATANMIVGVSVTSGTVLGVSDSQAQNYTLIGQQGNLYVFQFEGTRAMLAGHDFITVYLNGTTSPIDLIAIADPGTLDLDISVHASGTGTSSSVATGTLAQAYEHVLSFSWNSGPGGAPSWTSPGGITTLSNSSGNSAGFLTAAFVLTTATGSITPTASWASSTTWLIVTIGLRLPLHPAAAADAVAIAVATPPGDVAGASEALGIAYAVQPPATDQAAAFDAMQIVITTASQPWNVRVSADSTLLNRINFSQSDAALANIQVGQQFQFYSGDFQRFGIEGRLNSNQSFENATTSPWVAGNGATLSVSTLNPSGIDLGTHSCLITPNGSTALPQMTSEIITLPAGQQFGTSCRLTCPAGWASGAKMILQWLDSGNNVVGTINGVVTALSAGVQTILTIPLSTPPNNAVKAKFLLQIQGTPSAATLFYTDLIYLTEGNVLLNGGQVYTITALNTAFGFTSADFSPPMPALAVFANVARQVLSVPGGAPFAFPAFVRSRMPRMHLQNILNRNWIHRDVQGISQPLITFNLATPDTFTCSIAPVRSDLLDSTGNPKIVPWQTACYLEEDNDIKFGGLCTGTARSGAALNLGFTGFTGYANGFPYEGPLFRRTSIDALDVVRYLWRWLQGQAFADIGLEMGSDNSGLNLGTTLPPPTAKTRLKGDALKNQIAVAVHDLTGFKVGMEIVIGDETTKVRNLGDVPAGVKYYGVGPKPGTKGTFITLSAKLDHYHVDGYPVRTLMKPQPFELAWWNATDIGQEISSLQAEAIFDWTEKHNWNGSRTDVIHKLQFNVPRKGVRLGALRFAEGENIIQPAELSSDGSTFSNHVLALGAGQGQKMLRQAAGGPNGQLRRVFVYTDQTIRNPARLAAIAQKQLRHKINTDTVTSIVVQNHPNARFGSFATGDDIPVILNSPWRKATIWSRIISMTQDPTTDLMTLQLARSDSFTYMAESGQAGTSP